MYEYKFLKSEDLQQVQEIVRVLEINRENAPAYEYYQKHLHNKASSYELGYVLGWFKALFFVAKNMKQLGIEIEIIAQATGLAIEQIENLETRL